MLGNDIAGERIERSLVETIPFFAAGLGILILITYVLGFSLLLPQFFK